MLYRKKQAPSLLSVAGKERVKATLIFSRAKKYKWLNYILKDGFAHIRIVVHLPYVNVVIDPRVAYTTVECYASSDILTPEEGATVVRVERMVDIYKMRRLFGPLNCVETAKSYIGLSKPFIFTPYQLYKEVTKNG